METLCVYTAEMGLSSPGGENLLDFLELRQVLSTYDGDLRDTLWWPQERTGSSQGQENIHDELLTLK